MTAFLIDEMFPQATARILREKYGHDAVHVAEAGLQSRPDPEVAAMARAEGRVVITENARDFAAEQNVPQLFVLKRNFPRGGALAPALAEALDHWAATHPVPYVGINWLEQVIPRQNRGEADDAG